MADYIKTFATTCHGELLDAISADSGITPECTQIIDTDDGNMTFQFDSTLGGEETNLDTLLSGWSCPTEESDPSVLSYVFEEVYEADEIKTITLPHSLPNMVVHVMNPNVVENVGAELVSPKGTGWDPGNKSTNEASINNGILTDLVYNNSVSGSTEGIIFGVDMGSITNIDSMKKVDYSASYYDKHWEFIGTNNADGTGYTVIFEEEQDAPNLSTSPYERAFSTQSFRYYGCRCSESFNATYTIISELELYSGGTLQTVEKKLGNNIDYEYSWVSDTEVCIKNLGSEKTFKVIIMGS